MPTAANLKKANIGLHATGVVCVRKTEPHFFKRLEMPAIPGEYDVIVVGGGNAALCAALSARELGARVLLLERAPESERGGNSAFTGGTMRTVYSGLEDVRQLVP